MRALTTLNPVRQGSAHPSINEGGAPFRFLLGGAGTLALALALSGCGVHIDTDPGSLPELEGIDAARDAAARTEAAAAARAVSLSAAAVECATCRAALDSLATASQDRLASLGGLWDPWGGQTFTKAEQPTPVADAPLEVADLVSWLVMTAERDWRNAANPEIAGAAEAFALSSVAAGRYASAIALAQAYDLDIDAATASVAEFQSRIDTLADMPSLTSGGDVTWYLSPVATSSESNSANAWPTTLVTEEETEAGVPSGDTRLSAAVAVWDCVAQQAIPADVLHGVVDDGIALSEELLVRTDRALALGIADQRKFRCTTQASDAAEIAAALIQADLNLMGSDKASVRALGVLLYREDAQRWYALAPEVFGSTVGAVGLVTEVASQS